MALQTELLSLLDNSDEPISKRLRIATDVFNTNELPAFNKESVLFNWFGKTCSKTDTTEIWDTLLECLSSPRMKDISTNEIKHNVLSSVVKAIIKQLKKQQDENIKNNVVKCGISILNIDVFQQYFKHDLKHYCGLVSEILVNADDINKVRNIISMNLAFNEKILDRSEYTTYFLSSTLDALIRVLMKFQDENLFENSQELINRSIFSLNSNDFKNFLLKAFEQPENSDDVSSNIIYDKLKSLYTCDTQSAKVGFKIFFSSSLSICNTEILRYQLFVLIVHALGFKVKKLMKINIMKNDKSFELEKSLEILAEIFEVIRSKNLVIKEKVNEISFSDFLKSLILSIIRLQTLSNVSTLRILKYIIDIDPLIFANLIDEILAFVTFFKKDDNLQIIYSDLMISIMKMYFKLRRVGKFYAVLLETSQNKIFSNFKVSNPEIKFSGEIKTSSTADIVCSVKDVLPDNVLQYFQECVTLQASKEVTKILRNCVYHLKLISDDIQTYADDQKIFFVQIVSEITCNTLAGVNTAPEYSVNKFVTDMNSIRDELQKFGTALLTVEHNHLLMFSFLNICYTWAEVAILLTFYTSAENLNFKGESENNKSVNNLTYLHNYLSTEQWSLVLQRIKNFGEQPCKHILQKLLIQKLRAMLIFEKEVNEVIESSIVSSYATNLETSWDIILSERFIASSFVPKMESSQLITLAEYLIDHMVQKNNFELLKQRTIVDSRDLMTSVFYVCLSKICDLFKRKRKHSDSTSIKPLSTRIFKSIDENSFIKTEDVDVEKITEYFSEIVSEIKDLKMNEEVFNTFMEIIKYIPVTSLSYNVQVTLFLYLLSICFDLRNCRTQNSKCLEKCEEYLIALIENNLSSPNIFIYMKPDILVTKIIESVEKYEILLSYIIGKGVTQNDTIPSCKSVINILEKNMSDEKYLNTVFKTLHIFKDATLKNVSEENKAIIQKYKEKLYKKLLKHTTMDESISDNKIIMYTFLLEDHLTDDTDDTLTKLIPLMKQYLDYAINNINENNAKEFLNLFNLILTTKSSIIDLPKDFNMSAWKACKDLKNIDNYTHFHKLTTLLFEKASDDDFINILQELVDANRICIKFNQTDNIIHQIRIWKKILSSDLSFKKNQVITNIIQTLFSNLIMFLTNNSSDQDFNKEFVEMQINFIEKQKVMLSPIIIDVHFQTTQILISKQQTIEEFTTAFETGFPILETLTKSRTELLIDRLPTFLLHFRLYLHHLCLKSDSDVNLNKNQLVKIIDCAFKIEKLNRNICTLLKSEIVRITPNLIADFLKEYEQIALYPDVKYHLNNCLMELVALCDSHAVSYLLRVLSPASTELFKEIHNNYMKYYKYRGKV